MTINEKKEVTHRSTTIEEAPSLREWMGLMANQLEMKGADRIKACFFSKSKTKHWKKIKVATKQKTK